jgi:hypothetical protein
MISEFYVTLDEISLYQIVAIQIPRKDVCIAKRRSEFVRLEKWQMTSTLEITMRAAPASQHVKIGSAF